jgi:hypothetical protein
MKISEDVTKTGAKSAPQGMHDRRGNSKTQREAQPWLMKTSEQQVCVSNVRKGEVMVGFAACERAESMESKNDDILIHLVRHSPVGSSPPLAPGRDH